jgi:hypothetical protein
VNNEIKDNIPARTSPRLPRSSFTTTRNKVANGYAFHGKSYGIPPICLTFSQREIIISKLVTLLHALLLAKEKLATIILVKHASNLTGKTYYIKSFDPLDCSTENVIYDIECTLCGLLYVGETRQTLRSRMNKHRYDANDPQYRILYNHFNQPGHDRCLTMKVRIIEKIYHHTVQNLVHLTVPIESCFGLRSYVLQCLTVAMITSKEWEICQVLEAANST